MYFMQERDIARLWEVVWCNFLLSFN